MFLTDSWALLPGLTTARETIDPGTMWGNASAFTFANGFYSASMIDPTNTPTFECRPGLVIGQRTADGTFTNYLATNTDGSEVAIGWLITSIRVQDFQGVNQQRLFAFICGGRVQSAQLLGLDNMARSQMADRVIFDDDLAGRRYFPYRRFQSKTANYQIVATDNFSHFDNLGATGAVTFTLPAILNGYEFAFHALANQNIAITSNEGANIVALNNAVANTITFSTGAQIIGGGIKIYSNPAGTKWIVENISAGANTVSVS